MVYGNGFGSVCPEIRRKLERGDDGGAGALGDGWGVTQVVRMAMGQKNVVRVKLLRLGRGLRVATEERVDQNSGLVAFDPERRVSEKRNLHYPFYTLATGASVFSGDDRSRPDKEQRCRAQQRHRERNGIPLRRPENRRPGGLRLR